MSGSFTNKPASTSSQPLVSNSQEIAASAATLRVTSPAPAPQEPRLNYAQVCPCTQPSQLILTRVRQLARRLLLLARLRQPASNHRSLLLFFLPLAYKRGPILQLYPMRP